jgi:hypothetical protein
MTTRWTVLEVPFRFFIKAPNSCVLYKANRGELELTKRLLPMIYSSHFHGSPTSRIATKEKGSGRLLYAWEEKDRLRLLQDERWGGVYLRVDETNSFKMADAVFLVTAVKK